MKGKIMEMSSFAAFLIVLITAGSVSFLGATDVIVNQNDAEGFDIQPLLPSGIDDYIFDFNKTWTYPGASINQPISMLNGLDGYLYTMGHLATPDSIFLVSVAKWDQFGNLVWNRSWNSGYYLVPWDIHYLGRGSGVANDEIWVVGEIYPSSDADIFWLKYGTNGTFLGNWTWGGPGDDVGTCMDYNGDTNSFTLWGFTDSWKVKSHVLRMTIHTSGAVLANETRGDDVYDYQVHDAKGNFYTGVNGTFLLLVGRWDGTQWMRSMSLGTGISSSSKLASGYPYYVYVYVSTANEKPQLVCYNGTGVFQWSRAFVTPWTSTHPRGIHLQGSTIWTLTSHYANMTITAWTTSGTSLRNITRVDTAYHLPGCWAWRGNHIYVGSGLRQPGQELAIYSEDIDGDGLGAVTEERLGSSDNDLDSDDDTMPDDFEVYNDLDPADPADKKGDADGDGLANFLEYLIGTNVSNGDTDADGWGDRDEILANTSPFDPLDHPTSTGPAIDMNTIYIAMACIAGGFVIGLVVSLAAKKKKRAEK